MIATIAVIAEKKKDSDQMETTFLSDRRDND